jgi:hypothetical protein
MTRDAPVGRNDDAMISRTSTITTISQRSASMRRLQQHQRAANARLFCRTNGCATFMHLDSLTGVATCPICGARRRID